MAFSLPSWLPHLRGMFIAFEGPDGSGKSTQLKRFKGLCAAGDIKICEVREPGGTPLGEEVRKLLLDFKHEGESDIHNTAEMLLFMASRAQLVAEKIRPALERNELVIADRFIASTLAYQGTAGGQPIDDIRSVGHVALKGCWPDLNIVFDVDAETAEARMNPLLRSTEFEGKAKDRMESKGNAYHKRVRQGYHEQAKIDPDHFLTLDATHSPDDVFHDMIDALDVFFSNRQHIS